MAEEKRNWKEIIEQSNGTMIMLPEKFKDGMDDVEKSRKEFNEFMVQAAEKEILMNIATQDLFVELRKYLAKNGMKDIWVKEIGLNVAALEEGFYVVNIADGKQK